MNTEKKSFYKGEGKTQICLENEIKNIKYF